MEKSVYGVVGSVSDCAVALVFYAAILWRELGQSLNPNLIKTPEVVRFNLTNEGAEDSRDITFIVTLLFLSSSRMRGSVYGSCDSDSAANDT